MFTFLTIVTYGSENRPLADHQCKILVKLVFFFSLIYLHALDFHIRTRRSPNCRLPAARRRRAASTRPTRGPPLRTPTTAAARPSPRPSSGSSSRPPPCRYHPNVHWKPSTHMRMIVRMEARMLTASELFPHPWRWHVNWSMETVLIRTAS